MSASLSRAVRSAVEGFLLDLRVSGASPRALENRERILDKLHDAIGDDLSALTRPNLIAFFERYRAAGRAALTVHTYATVAHRFLRWMVDAGVLTEDPLRGFAVRVPKALPRVPTTDEVRALLRACDVGTVEGMRNRGMLLLFCDSGLRLSELLRLRVEDVQWGTRTIAVSRGKGAKDRTAHFGPTTLKALRTHLDRCRATEEDLVFAYADGRPMTRRHALAVLHRLSRKAGLSWRVHPHSLRHFCGVSILRNTGNLEIVRQTLGHESLPMALHYARLASLDVAKAYRRASPVDTLMME